MQLDTEHLRCKATRELCPNKREIALTHIIPLEDMGIPAYEGWEILNKISKLCDDEAVYAPGKCIEAINGCGTPLVIVDEAIREFVTPVQLKPRRNFKISITKLFN